MWYQSLISVTFYFAFVKGDKVDFYSHIVKDIHGNDVSLEKYRGKVSLVVNVASECGFTDGHYKGLVQLHRLLHTTGKFNVLGFPCNQFGAQEPGTEAQILKFGQDRYDVNFPLFSKVNVIDEDVSPVWQYITQNANPPTWNFWKYLVDPDGKIISYFGPWSDIEEVTPHVKRAVDDALQAKGPKRPAKQQKSRDESYMTEGHIEDPKPQEDADGTPGTNPTDKKYKHEARATIVGRDDL